MRREKWVRLPLAVSLGLVLALAPQGSWAAQVSAGVREFYNTPTTSSFGGDRAAKMKMELGRLGFSSVTLQVRLGINDLAGDLLFHPIQRSSKADLEVMISRLYHAHEQIILKPVIFVNPGMGAPAAAPELASRSPNSLFASYEQIISLYQSLAHEREIDEFVIGAGMGSLLLPEFLDRWEKLLKGATQSLSARTVLSLELSASRDLDRMEALFARNPATFSRTFGSIKKIWVSLPIKEYWNFGLTRVDPSALERLLRNRHSRLHALFPEAELALSQVTVPACLGFSAVEAEVTCANQLSRLSADALQVQGENLKLFFEGFDNAIKQGQSFESLELMTAATEDEPLPEAADPRYLLYNPNAKKILSERFAQDSPFIGLFESKKRAFLSVSAAEVAASQLACVYFDESDGADLVGPLHARLLENLIGAFKSWRTERRAMLKFESHDLELCDRVFYIGSNFELQFAPHFLDELAEFSQTKSVVWFNYKISKWLAQYRLMASQRNWPAIGFDVPRIIQPDQLPSAAVQDPGFFRYFDYKGETFEKLARWDGSSNRFMSSPEIHEISVRDQNRVQILSSARHSKSGVTTPYAVSNPLKGGGVYYFADLPFSFSHYEDRFLILCDVIWDILGEVPKYQEHIALVRLEDVGAGLNPADLHWAVDYLSDQNIPFSLAVIPFYSDLFSNQLLTEQKPSFFSIDRVPSLIGEIKYASARGAEIVYHGVSHQAGDQISGFNGSTGSDYEFWLWPENRPLAQDSSDYFLRQLELGESVFKKLGPLPSAWEFPHYAGSALDSVISGKLFEWSYHRGLYVKSETVTDVQLSAKDRMFECESLECRKARAKALKGLQVQADYRTFGTQVIPYPVHHDSYGQALIPETLGCIDFPSYGCGTWRQVTRPEDLIRRAKKLKVIRGSMASFFWHPELLSRNNSYYLERPESYETIGDKFTLIQTIEGLKALGYRFRSIGDCELFPRLKCRDHVEKKRNKV